jgi:hypothetical protein
VRKKLTIKLRDGSYLNYWVFNAHAEQALTSYCKAPPSEKIAVEFEYGGSTGTLLIKSEDVLYIIETPIDEIQK